MLKKTLLPVLIASFFVLLFLSEIKAEEEWGGSYEKSYEVNEKIEVNESASGPDGASVNVQIKNTINANGESKTEIKTSKSPNPSTSSASSGNSQDNPTQSPDGLSATQEAEMEAKVLGQSENANIFVKIWVRVKAFWRGLFGFN